MSSFDVWEGGGGLGRLVGSVTVIPVATGDHRLEGSSSGGGVRVARGSGHRGGVQRVGGGLGRLSERFVDLVLWSFGGFAQEAGAGSGARGGCGSGGGCNHTKGDYGSRCGRGGRCWGFRACDNRGWGRQPGRERGCWSDGAGGVILVHADLECMPPIDP